MASKKNKRPSRPPRRTAIVPRVVFQTIVAAAVVPTMGAVALGCGNGVSPASDAGYDAQFSVAMPLPDGGRDTGNFSVAVDASPDVGFGVADVGFSVAAPLDSGFSVVIVPVDGGEFGVLVAPGDASSSS